MSDTDIHYTVAINRIVDITITFLNSLVALLLLTAPWYKITLDTVFNGCNLTRGTVIAPFSSGICNYESLASLPLEQGKHWTTMYNYSMTYFIFAVIISSLVGYEVVVFGIRKLNNANTISFVLNLISVIIQSMILIEVGNVIKPAHVSNEIALTFISVALGLSCVRVLALGWFMYHQRQTEPIGMFGTGARKF